METNSRPATKAEIIAPVCHAVNKAYCESIGDYSQPDWKDAPDWQKESAVKGAQFHLDNPDAKPDLRNKKKPEASNSRKSEASKKNKKRWY